MLILSGSLLREADLLQPCQPAFCLARSDSDLQMHLPEHSLSIRAHCCPSKFCGSGGQGERGFDLLDLQPSSQARSSPSILRHCHQAYRCWG